MADGRTARGRKRVAAVAALLAVVALVVSCTPPPSDPGSPPTTLVPLPAPPSTFSLLTYNVAGLPQEFSTVNPKDHLPLISPLLNPYDVVLTQEDFDWWTPLAGLLDFANYHRRLRAEATHPYRSDVHPGPAAVGVDPNARPLLVGDGIGFLSRFPLLDERHVAWEGCFGGPLPPGAADCLAMKGFRVMTMVLGDGLEVDVYNLHAEAGGTPEDQALQVRDYEQLAEAIETWSAGRAVIVAGDTNLHIGEHETGLDAADREIWRTFLDRVGMTDSCDALDCPEPTSIDKVAFRSGGGVQLDPQSWAMPRDRFRSPAGTSLSDHPPLVVEFGWDVATAA